MWIGIWIGRRKDEQEFAAFIKRYWEFHRDDIVYVCEWHHAEIHHIYDGIIQEFKKKLGKPLYKATWEEAEELMQLLEAACVQWLAQQTPGYNPAQLKMDRLAGKIGQHPRPKKRRKRKRHGRKNRQRLPRHGA